MRLRVLAFVAAAAPLFSAVLAHANPVTYTETFLASGSLNGAAFTNQTISLTGSGDTANLTYPGPHQIATPVQLSIAIGAADLVTATQSAAASVNPDGSAFLFSEAGDGAFPVMFSLAFETWGMDTSTALSTFVGNSPTSLDLPYDTTGGTLLFTQAASTGTFSAAVVASTPEPSSLVLLATGLLAVAALWRRSLQPARSTALRRVLPRRRANSLF